MKQISFQPSDNQLMIDIDDIRLGRYNNISRSKMIDILLHEAVKEKNRKRKVVKKSNS